MKKIIITLILIASVTLNVILFFELKYDSLKLERNLTNQAITAETKTLVPIENSFYALMTNQEKTNSFLVIVNGQEIENLVNLAGYYDELLFNESRIYLSNTMTNTNMYFDLLFGEKVQIKNDDQTDIETNAVELNPVITEKIQGEYKFSYQGETYQIQDMIYPQINPIKK